MSRGEDPLIYSEVDEEEDDYSDCEGRYVAAKTPVFWDMDGWTIPEGGNVELISKNIISALVNEGFGDTVTLYAYGDMDQIDGLESFGIMPRYFSAGGELLSLTLYLLTASLMQFYFFLIRRKIELGWSWSYIFLDTV